MLHTHIVREGKTHGRKGDVDVTRSKALVSSLVGSIFRLRAKAKCCRCRLRRLLVHEEVGSLGDELRRSGWGETSKKKALDKKLALGRYVDRLVHIEQSRILTFIF